MWVNLRKWRVRHETGRRFRPKLDDPELAIILCSRGHIGYWDPNEIVASLDVKSGKARQELKELGFALWQDGQDGQNWIGPMSKLNELAKIMRARHRAQLSEEQKAIRVAGLARWRQKHTARGPQIDPGSPQIG